MAGFVASPPPTSEAIADGDGWWPSLSIDAFKKAMRLPREVTDERVREALVAGMIETSRELAVWKAAQMAGGAASLEVIPSPSFGGETLLVILYRRAAHSLAAADLADTHNDISATDAGRQRTDIRATSATEHRRNATQAVRAIKGRSRSRARLI